MAKKSKTIKAEETPEEVKQEVLSPGVPVTEGMIPEPESNDRQISLARANKLRNAMDKEIKKVSDTIKLKLSSTVRVFPDEDEKAMQSKIDQAKNEIRSLYIDFSNLTTVHSNLRKIIGEANIQSGIAGLLVEIERLTRAIDLNESIYSSYGGIQVRDERAIDFRMKENERLLRLREEALTVQSVASATPQAFDVGLVTKEEVEREKNGISDLQKNRSDLEEQRNALNYSTTIRLAANVVEFLEKKKLL